MSLGMAKAVGFVMLLQAMTALSHTRTFAISTAHSDSEGKRVSSIQLEALL